MHVVLVQIQNRLQSPFSSPSAHSGTALHVPLKGGRGVSTVKQFRDQLHTMEEMVRQHHTQQGGSAGAGSIGHLGSIMQAKIHRGGGGEGGRGHRQRDREKLLEERKREPATDNEPHTLTADERMLVRKRREAYFQSREQSGTNQTAALPRDEKPQEKVPAARAVKSEVETKENSANEKKHRLGGTGPLGKKQASETRKVKAVQSSGGVSKELRDSQSANQAKRKGDNDLVKVQSGEQGSTKESDTVQTKVGGKAQLQSSAKQGGMNGVIPVVPADSQHQLGVKDGANAAGVTSTCIYKHIMS